MTVHEATMFNDRFEQALSAEHPLGALRSLALDWVQRGQSRETVLAAFERQRQHLREAGQEQAEEVVMEVMDFLTGWCSPHVRLPDPPAPTDPHRS